MVRPGFYLGRAYIHRLFVLNFTLHNEEFDQQASDAWVKTGDVQEDCWVGTQTVVAQADG